MTGVFNRSKSRPRDGVIGATSLGCDNGTIASISPPSFIAARAMACACDKGVFGGTGVFGAGFSGTGIAGIGSHGRFGTMVKGEGDDDDDDEEEEEEEVEKEADAEGAEAVTVEVVEVVVVVVVASTEVKSRSLRLDVVVTTSIRCEIAKIASNLLFGITLSLPTWFNRARLVPGFSFGGGGGIDADADDDDDAELLSVVIEL